MSSDIMQPSDYIAFENIQGPEHLERIREGVRAMGWTPAPDYGVWDEPRKAFLKMTPIGDLTWSNHPNNGRRWHSNEVTAWVEQGDEGQ